MTSSPRATLVLVSAVVLAACGGRSQLRDAGAGSAASAGGGGGPTTSSASVSSGSEGGQGGGGGTPNGCILDGAPIGLAGIEGYGLSNPILVAPGGSDLTTLLAGWTATGGPMSSATELRHTSFPAWGTWPADATIGPSYLIDYDGGEHFDGTSAPDGFYVFFGSPSTSMNGINFTRHLQPASGDPGIPAEFGEASNIPLFAAQGTDPTRQLLGFTVSKPAPYAFDVYTLIDAPVGQVLGSTLGCAAAPIVAGAARVSEGFVVAFSSDTPFADPACLTGGPAPGSTSRLLLARVDNAGNVTPTGQIDDGAVAGSILALKVLPRSDGAWIVWTEQTDSTRARAARVNPQGELIAGPFDIEFFGDPRTLSAASLGDRLAVAWTFSATDVSPSVHVRIVDPGGAIAVKADILVNAISQGRTALLGSPSEKALLVAWTGYSKVGPRLQLARLACALP